MTTQENRALGAVQATARRLAGVKMPAPIALMALLACRGAPAAQGPWQAPETIQRAALAFAEARAQSPGGRVQIEPRPVDPRLRLRRCDRPLEAYAPSDGALRGNSVVGVRCPGATPWKVFVPMRVRVMAPVAVAAGPLPAGARVGEADVRWEEQDVARGVPGFVAGRGSPVGRVLRHAVRDGQTLRPGMLRAATLIRRGERVTLAVNHPSLAIRMVGVALRDGAMGDRIRAKNDSSGRIVEGTVRGQGLVEIDIF